MHPVKRTAAGGHTKEMFGLLRALNTKNYRPITFVVANTDDKSQHKLAEFRKDMVSAR